MAPGDAALEASHGAGHWVAGSVGCHVPSVGRDAVALLLAQAQAGRSPVGRWDGQE